MKIFYYNNSKNIIGPKLRHYRKASGLTQKGLALKLQLQGFEFSDLTILRIENGQRIATDFEVKALAQTLGISYQDLLD